MLAERISSKIILKSRYKLQLQLATKFTGFAIASLYSKLEALFTDGPTTTSNEFYNDQW